MEHFPDETIAEARRIAELYRKRCDSKHEQITKLYTGSFLNLSYGFESALKSGRCGHFLHEAEKDAECFSYVGMVYVIARELDLKPTMYDVRDMMDVKYGENPLECMVTDHCFLSVRLRGKEWAVDRMMGIIGDIKHYDDHLVITEHFEDSLVKSIPTERRFSSIREMDEREYAREMIRHQSQEGGRITLGCAQRVLSKGFAVMVQYLPEAESLSASIIVPINPNISEVQPSKKQIYELVAPLKADGSWVVGEGKIRVYRAESTGWTREQHTLAHRVINYDYDTVKGFRQHLDTAARHFGRKGSLEDLSQKNYELYFTERGFSRLGEIVAENGVEPKEHQRLLDEIVLGLPEEEPLEVRDFTNQQAAYFAAAQAAIGKDNPLGLIHPETERKDFIRECLDDAWVDMYEHVSVLQKSREMMCGLGGNSRAIERKILTYKNSRDTVTNFLGWANERENDRDGFTRQIDWALFQREHPSGTVKASEEERLNWYRHQAFMDMVDMCNVLPALELQKYRAGLKRILARA